MSKNKTVSSSRKDEFDPVRIIHPKGIYIIFFAVQLVSAQCRVERIFPESNFLFLGFFLQPFREFSVVLLKQARYSDGLDSHSASGLSASFRNRGLPEIGSLESSPCGIPATPFQRAGPASLRISLSGNK